MIFRSNSYWNFGNNPIAIFGHFPPSQSLMSGRVNWGKVNEKKANMIILSESYTRAQTFCTNKNVCLHFCPSSPFQNTPCSGSGYTIQKTSKSSKNNLDARAAPSNTRLKGNAARVAGVQFLYINF